ncbi:D-alpha,beta-D-heptose 1,7-bisphosphate phosphatase [Geoalkalibacter ferrihydriticus]|uniref:D,D-heptose 1,7-bisphosphate phosphatase n=2 Tax=Geoalkalibacter ferrihydriticus TaxID=392333 RepID=A0A0C2HFT0_9BACT|nr:D-glycero-beta-D-manno-heptose 1,7-bisphosphate 7-phosphatase [Geoalkalibacter ferrihydriticus]KIH75776.1 D,D-heptose 1,7-bisphosphate phosphatase [Geoalkalibacter ferrihydriticus DSM 17813]SDM64537.1 D-alpha,beta-D-heptose 1,7-bisphosphate phosphatase [Geoalkalibacter ferrihydriticus]
MNDQTLRRAVFLDRDGTINVEKDYLFRPEDFEFIPGAPEAIARLKQAGFLVIVVTNQSGVARGYFSVDEVRALHDFLQKELAPFGAAVDAFYLCPHHPEQGVGSYKSDCDCRKGRPGMLLRAAAEHAIDLRRSFMVGDKVADVEAGRRAGCRSLLVLTGYGETEATKIGPEDAVVVADLAQAVDYILHLEGMNL